MSIDKVVLKNIRGFADLQFDLARPNSAYAGWTVFTGNNGSGKSTLLKAIAIGLTGKDTARALQPSFHRWIREGIGDDDEASIQLEIVRQAPDDALVDSGAKPGAAFPAKIILKNSAKETTLHSAIPAKKPKNYSTPDRTLWSTDAKGWFSCGYGPFRRVFGASPEAARQMIAPSTERFVTMFQEAASLAEVDQWLRNLKKRQAMVNRKYANGSLDIQREWKIARKTSLLQMVLVTLKCHGISTAIICPANGERRSGIISCANFAGHRDSRSKTGSWPTLEIRRSGDLPSTGEHHGHSRTTPG